MNLHIDPTELRPVIEATVAEVLAQRDAGEARLGNRRWTAEVALAAEFGLPAHRLRDCRRRGEIVGTKVGKQVGYTPDQIQKFLESQRLEP